MEFSRVLREALLVSRSKRNAVYRLQLCELPDGNGYVVAKESGPTGSQQIAESWYRETLEKAERKFAAILCQKTNRSSGRRYRQVEALEPGGQLSLLGEAMR